MKIEEFKRPYRKGHEVNMHLIYQRICSDPEHEWIIGNFQDITGRTLTGNTLNRMVAEGTLKRVQLRPAKYVLANKVKCLFCELILSLDEAKQQGWMVVFGEKTIASCPLHRSDMLMFLEKKEKENHGRATNVRAGTVRV